MSISKDDFERACKDLCAYWRHSQSDEKTASILEQYNIKYLRITQPVSIQVERARPAESEGANDETEEHLQDDGDAEALCRAEAEVGPLQAIFDIIHSPSYQVPVLFLQVNVHALGKVAKVHSLDDIYEMLVPPTHRLEMQAVGVLGALSMTDHPVSGLPAYFVHPCRTADAMADVVGRATVPRPTEYLLLWLGLVGASVGLHVPIEVAKAMNEP